MVFVGIPHTIFISSNMNPSLENTLQPDRTKMTGNVRSEARSCNHCCGGKALSITHSSVCVCSLRYTACNAHAPYRHLALSASTVFCHILQGHDFRKIKMFLKLLSETCSMLRRIERDMTEDVYWSSCKLPIIRVRF